VLVLWLTVRAEQGGAEVSFTGLAVRTLGNSAGRVVALVYAFLNYALLVACVAGLHSILAHWLPLHPALVCILSPGVVVSMLAFTSFQAVDTLNRALCGLMLASITGLVGIGISVGRKFWLGSVSSGTWSFSALSPAIPIIALTLGFHVITPVVCQVVGGKPQEARKAILCGGAVPLLMVLAWNAVIVGLAQAPAGSPVASIDPIKLLLSLSSTAAPVVQAFAFAALGTTLIGYALSFPKQLIDSVSLFGIRPQAEEKVRMTPEPERSRKMAALFLAMAPPVALAMISPTAFASALGFAGLYANCFLFGVLPPIMAWVYRYQQPQADQVRHTQLVPGGRILLFALLLIAVYLGLKPPNTRM
jgi:amino acid permease